MPTAGPTVDELFSKRVAETIADLTGERERCSREIQERQRRIEVIDSTVSELKHRFVNGKANGKAERGSIPAAVRDLIKKSPAGLTSKEIVNAVVASKVTDNRVRVHGALFQMKKLKQIRFDEKSEKYFPMAEKSE